MRTLASLFLDQIQKAENKKIDYQNVDYKITNYKMTLVQNVDKSPTKLHDKDFKNDICFLKK